MEEDVAREVSADDVGEDVVSATDRYSMRVLLELSGEQAAAVEGWRVANRIASDAEAVRELVRIGLLSEIGRIYRMVTAGNGSDERQS